MLHPYIIFSDSEILIRNIKFAFEGSIDFSSFETPSCILQNTFENNLKLIIVDLDMKIENHISAVKVFREISEKVPVLFLVSEKRVVELLDIFGGLRTINTPANWLMKPYSRNALISSVQQLCV
ncbi:MAG: hypothetical protein PQJ46_12330 [Spirochaetales bacterium]|nr:hypothetical protein [Spirochaetales bacterium]